MNHEKSSPLNKNIKFQEIDELLSGGLTAEDESDVLAELDQIMKVHLILFYNLKKKITIILSDNMSIVKKENRINKCQFHLITSKFVFIYY